MCIVLAYARVRYVNTASIISTVIGTGTAGYNGENLVATSTNLNGPSGIGVDSSNGDIYVSSSIAYRVMVLSKTYGLVSTYAGSGTSGSAGNGGFATAATIGTILDIRLVTDGKLYLSENSANKVRLVYAVVITTVSTVTPSVNPSPVPSVVPTTLPSVFPSITPSMVPSITPSVVPSAHPSILPSAVPSIVPSIVPTVVPSLVPTSCPSFIATSPPSTSAPSSVRSSTNFISAVIGTGTGASTGTGGYATSAAINAPRTVWLDTGGIIYVVEAGGNCVRKVDTSLIVGNVAGVCGTGSSDGGDGGPATSAIFHTPVGLYGTTTGLLYLSDYLNHRIRVISGGIITTFAGLGSSGSSGDGGYATSAEFSGPNGLFMDTSYNLFVTDTVAFRIRRIDSSNIVTLFVGEWL